ncbi:MAG: YHS domain-containing (seleno)protein [Hyphomicrobiaceae bacterium]
MTSRRTFLGFAAATALTATSALMIANTAVTPAAAQSSAVYVKGGYAVSGYDPVAYFTENKPVQGNPAISLEHGGARYLFANEANRAAFQQDPAKYAPQYGGYCAYAVAQGSTAHGDPHAWSINNGKLYLNYNQSVRASWSKNIPGYVAKADANWPKLAGK